MKSSAMSSEKVDTSPSGPKGLSRAPAGRSSGPLTAPKDPHNGARERSETKFSGASFLSGRFCFCAKLLLPKPADDRRRERERHNKIYRSISELSHTASTKGSLVIVGVGN